MLIDTYKLLQTSKDMISMTVDKFYYLAPIFEDKKNSNLHDKGNNKNWHKTSFIICNSCLWCASCLIGLENTATCPSCNKSSLSRMKIVSNNVHPSKEELSTLNLMKGF